MSNYAVRITRSYDICQRAIAAWALKCDKILAYEHTGTVTEKVHVHLIMIGVTCTVDTLHNIARPLGLATLKGNGDWSFKTKDKKYGPVTDSPKYITYMTKGNLEPRYNKGYTQAELDEAKASWVNKDTTSLQRREYLAWAQTVCAKDLIEEFNKMSSRATDKLGYELMGFVRGKVLQKAYQKYGLLSPGAMSMVKTWTLTYCYENAIPVDSKYMWK